MSKQQVESKNNIPKLDKPSDCIICTESLNNVDAPLPCGHWLHLSCVKKHFKPECPICRTKLDIEVTGTKPEPYIPYNPPQQAIIVAESSPIRTQAGLFMVRFSLVPIRENYDYIYPEEDPDFDEENPFGDEYDYPDEE